MAAGLKQTDQKGPTQEVKLEIGQQTSMVFDEAQWDEAQIEKAMETLKQMHIKLRDMRTTVPRLLAPLTVKQVSPVVMLREFAIAAKIANQEVEQFRQLINDAESKKVLEQARKSRSENPEGIRPWRITEHPDWLDTGS